MSDPIQSRHNLPEPVPPGATDWRAREKREILDALRARRTVTRTEIGRLTGLSRAVVQQRLAELLETGTVAESGMTASTGGRPPRGVRFRSEAGRLLVADLGATSLGVAVTDLAGTVLAHAEEPVDIATGPDPVLGRVEALFDELAAAGTGAPVWGVGIGLPGPVEFTTGRPVAPPLMPGWDGYPVRERLGRRFSAPTWVDNDVNVMALGECAAGAGQGAEHVIFVKIGTGIGAGIVSHGRLHRGAQGSAGDVGHIQVVFDEDVVCRCGNVGCLEAVAGGAALARTALELARTGASPRLAETLASTGTVTAADLSTAANHGDRAAIETVQEAGRRVGQMLASAVNLFNPSLIVIGGGVAGAGDLLIASIREVVYGRSLPLATRHLTIRRSVLGDQAGVTGAAAMVLGELFDPVCLARWIEAGSPAGWPELAGR